MMVARAPRVIVQGITGHQGSRHASEMLAFGTNIVAGVTPGKGGMQYAGIPIFNSVSEAVEKYEADSSAIFVPAKNCMSAAMESLDAGIKLIVIVTEHVPLHDSMKIRKRAEDVGCTVIGPNSPGIAIPGKTKIGIMPNQIFLRGNVAVLSRSGTLTYEVVQSLSDAGIGQSLVVGIGGDQVVGSSMAKIAELYLKNNRPDSIVLVGEIGGNEEVLAAEMIGKWYGGKVIAYITGRSAPPGKRMGHAGAIIDSRSGSYDNKVAELRRSGVEICMRISGITGAVKKGAYT